jgi:outer membrane protein
MKDRGTDVTLLNNRMKENALKLKSLEIDDSARSLAESVATQYFSILYLEESVRVEEETLEYYKKLLNRNVERYKVGLSIKSDVLQAENAVLTAESNLVSTRARLEDAMRTLMETIGYEEGVAVSLAPLDISTFEPTTLHKKDLWASVIATDYSLKQLQTTETNYGLSDLYYENQLKPDIDVTAAIASQGNDDNFGGSFDGLPESQNYSLMLTYNLPWGKREIKGKMQENEISRGQLAAQRRQVLDSLKTRYESLRREIGTTIKTLELAESNVMVAAENADIMRERQHVGLATTLDVLEGERSLLQAKLAYLNAVTGHLRAEYQLKILAGLAP